MPAAPHGCGKRGLTCATPTPCWRGSSTTGRTSTPGRGWPSCRRWTCTEPCCSRSPALALRKAIQAAYQLDHLPTQDEVLAIAEKWRPYRSLTTSYLFSAAFEPAEAPVVRHRSA